MEKTNGSQKLKKNVNVRLIHLKVCGKRLKLQIKKEKFYKTNFMKT